MDDRELLAAAQLACDREVWDRCINTSDRTRAEIDIDAALPDAVPRTRCSAQAQEIGLDPAYVYGLIRQESRFIMDARSGVGASRPDAADAGHRALDGEEDRPAATRRRLITDRDTNLRLGTAYLKLVLDDFGGSQPMAAAAYNAGPGRPRTLARRAGARAGDLGREHPVQRDARLRQEGADQRHLLRARCSAARARPSARGSAGRSARAIRTRRRSTRSCPEPGRRPRRESPLAERPAHASAMHRKFLILGGTGFVGRSVCREAGRTRRRRRRPDPHRRPAAPHRAKPLQLAAHRRGGGRPTCTTRRTLARLLRSSDAVINLVAILHGSEAEFERVHVAPAARLAAACRDGRRAARRARQRARRRAPMRRARYLRSKAARRGGAEGGRRST